MSVKFKKSLIKRKPRKPPEGYTPSNQAVDTQPPISYIVNGSSGTPEAVESESSVAAPTPGGDQPRTPPGPPLNPPTHPQDPQVKTVSGTNPGTDPGSPSGSAPGSPSGSPPSPCISHRIIMVNRDTPRPANQPTGRPATLASDPAIQPSATLTPKQDEANLVLSGPCRHIQIRGGSRSGKSMLLMRAMLIRGCRFPGSRQVIFRLHRNAAVNSIWRDTLPTCKRLFFPSLTWVQNESDYFITLPNGSEIWVAGLDDKDRVDKILGMEFNGIWFNECSQIPYSSVKVALTRLSKLTYNDQGEQMKNRAYYDLNPVGKFHWSYRLFHEKRDPETLRPTSNPQDYAICKINPRDNAANLDSTYLAEQEATSGKHKQRFWEGEYVDQFDNALWSYDQIESNRVTVNEVPGRYLRIVVSIDPSGCSGPDDKRSDQIGINVSAYGRDKHFYVLADRSGWYSPSEWARVATELFDQYEADSIIAEKNYGGEMVREVLKLGGRKSLPIRLITSSRGKTLRAEPVSTLYDQGLVHHVGAFPDLEEEMCAFTSAGYQGPKSPNRADALVFSLTDLAQNFGVLGLVSVVNTVSQLIESGMDEQTALDAIDSGAPGEALGRILSEVKARQQQGPQSQQTGQPQQTGPEQDSGPSQPAQTTQPTPIPQPVPIPVSIQPTCTYAVTGEMCPECKSGAMTRLATGNSRCQNCGWQTQVSYAYQGTSRGDWLGW